MSDQASKHSPGKGTEPEPSSANAEGPYTSAENSQTGPAKLSGRVSDYEKLADAIRRWSEQLGFQQLGICDTDLTSYEAKLAQWLQDGFHGEMDYMQRHGAKRSQPGLLVEGTCRVISVRMDYMPPGAAPAEDILADRSLAYVSRYALGRDYHKLMRKRLQQLADRIAGHIGEFGYRVFVDSAPVLEKAIAEKAGLGWIGKHSNLINKSTGSWFFLGEIYTDLPLPCTVQASVLASGQTSGQASTVKADTDNTAAKSTGDTSGHCGDCTACIQACPTQAIVSPYRVDARRCISYLTIELHGAIPVEFRQAMGNRIYGCDDCQLCCPWNRFTHETTEQDYLPRHGLDNISLLELFNWDEASFLKNTEGSAIRRIGYIRWLRNIAVALGNSQPDGAMLESTRASLQARLGLSEMLDEHIHWALQQLAE